MKNNNLKNSMAFFSLLNVFGWVIIIIGYIIHLHFEVFEEGWLIFLVIGFICSAVGCMGLIFVEENNYDELEKMKHKIEFLSQQVKDLMIDDKLFNDDIKELKKKQ